MIADDAAQDLAILRITSPAELKPAGLRTDSDIRLGEDVLVAGFPLGRSQDLHISVGTINALIGRRNDPNRLQISAPIQSGYSGGPVLDRSGNVVGVMTEAGRIAAAEESGVILQNANFAVRSNTVRRLLEVNGVDYRVSRNHKPMTNPEIAEAARKYTLAVECRN